MNQPNPPENKALTDEVFVLVDMIQQLPSPIGQLILNQLGKLLHALNERDLKFVQKVSGLVEDVKLEIKIQEFDLEMTRKERDGLMDRRDQT